MLLRNHVNEFILNNKERRRKFDAEYKKRGTLTYDKMTRVKAPVYLDYDQTSV